MLVFYFVTLFSYRDAGARIRRYLRPYAQISPSLLGDIFVLIRRYLRPYSEIYFVEVSGHALTVWEFGDFKVDGFRDHVPAQ